MFRLEASFWNVSQEQQQQQEQQLFHLKTAMLAVKIASIPPVIGQSWVLQVTVILEMPLQTCPPFFGDGLLHTLTTDQNLLG